MKTQSPACRLYTVFGIPAFRNRRLPGRRERRQGFHAGWCVASWPEARQSPGDGSVGTLQIWRGYRSHAVKLPDLREIVNYP